MLDAVLREHGEELYARAYLLTGHRGSAHQLLEDALVWVLSPVRLPRPADARALVLGRMHLTVAARRGARFSGGGAPALDEVAEAPEHTRDGPASGALHWGVRAAREYVADHPLDRTHAYAQLLAGVASLEPVERVCVVLRFLDGLSADAIAEECDIEPGRVRDVLADAVERLARASPGLGLDPHTAAWGGSESVVIEAAR